jgi:hypothetical protein
MGEWLTLLECRLAGGTRVKALAKTAAAGKPPRARTHKLSLMNNG